MTFLKWSLVLLFKTSQVNKDWLEPIFPQKKTYMFVICGHSWGSFDIKKLMILTEDECTESFGMKLKSNQMLKTISH